MELSKQLAAEEVLSSAGVRATRLQWFFYSYLFYFLLNFYLYMLISKVPLYA